MRSRTIRAFALSLTLAAGATVVTACGDDGDKADTTTTTASTGSPSTTAAASTSSTASSTTAAPSTTATTATTGPGGETTAGLGSLPEGSHYGYFKGISDGKVEGQAVSVVGFDKVDLLTGQEAKDAAEAAGETLDTDYYIRNDNPLVRKLPVIPDSSITVLAESGTGQVPAGIEEAVSTPGLYKIEVVVVRGVSLITGVEGVYLP